MVWQGVDVRALFLALPLVSTTFYVSADSSLVLSEKL